MRDADVIELQKEGDIGIYENKLPALENFTMVVQLAAATSIFEDELVPNGFF